MRPSRRDLLGLLAAKSTYGLAGCSIGYQQPEHGDSESDTEMTNRESKHFNDDGELTSPVNNGSVDTREARITGTDTVQIHVPTDYDTLVDALAGAAVEYRSRQADVEVVIESGHAILNEVHLDSTNLRHVTITSEDATVPVDSGVADPVFLAENRSAFPQIGCLFDGGGMDRLAIRVFGGSSVHVLDGSGFQGFTRGLIASRSSTITSGTGHSVISRDMSERGVTVTDASAAWVQNADASNCRDFGVRIASASIAQCSDMNLSGSRIGIQGGGASTVIAEFTDATNCDDHGMKINKGVHLQAYNADFSGAGMEDVWVGSGSIATIHGATTTSGTPGVGDTNHDSFNSVSSDGIIFA